MSIWLCLRNNITVIYCYYFYYWFCYWGYALWLLFEIFLFVYFLCKVIIKGWYFHNFIFLFFFLLSIRYIYLPSSFRGSSVRNVSLPGFRPCKSSSVSGFYIITRLKTCNHVLINYTTHENTIRPINRTKKYRNLVCKAHFSKNTLLSFGFVKPRQNHALGIFIGFRADGNKIFQSIKKIGC